MTTLCWTYEVITREDFMKHYGNPLGKELLACFHLAMISNVPSYNGHRRPETLKFIRTKEGLHTILWDDGKNGSRHYSLINPNVTNRILSLNEVCLLAFASGGVICAAKNGRHRKKCLNIKNTIAFILLSNRDI